MPWGRLRVAFAPERRARKQEVPHVYWGPSYNQHEIYDVVTSSKVRYSTTKTTERRLETAIQLLQAGKIVGWFQGAAEFGPRALGNRSLLASPWAPYVKENLNDYIKHREWFRPSRSQFLRRTARVSLSVRSSAGT